MGATVVALVFGFLLFVSDLGVVPIPRLMAIVGGGGKVASFFLQI